MKSGTGRHSSFVRWPAMIALAGLLAGPASALAGPGPTSATDRLAAFSQRNQSEASSIVKNLKFRNIGPIQMNGRIADIEFPDPNDPYTFLVGYASGGLWKTTNNGTTFEPIFDKQASIIVGDIAVDPKNAKVYWVGTGESNASRSTYSGTGVYKTEDGGKTWKNMGLAEIHRIARIVVHPTNPLVVWVAAQGPLYTESKDRGIYKTTDGGKTWKKTLFVDEMTGATDLALQPANPKIIYAAMWTKDRKPWGFTHSGKNSGIWRSEDGGETWKRLAGGLPSGELVGRIGLAVSPVAPNVVYATVDNKAPKPDKDQPEPSDSPLAPEKLKTMTEQQFLAQKDEDIRALLRRFHPEDTVERVRAMVRDGRLTVKDLVNRLVEANPSVFDKEIIGAQVYRSDNRGDTWTLQNTGYLDDVFSTYGYYFADIRVSPNDVNTVYLLGVPIIKSTDGGKTWKAADNRQVHSDHHALWIDPHHPDHIVNGNDGGLNVSWDGGATWIKVANVPAGQFYFITVDMAQPYNVYGGLQDNGVWMGPSNRLADQNAGWVSIGGGDGMQVQVDTRTNQLYIQGSQYGNYRATEKASGKSWAVRPLSHVNEAYNRYNWQSPVLMSPHTPEIVYFGTQRVYRSFDLGRTFNAISPDLTTNRQPPSSDTPYSTIVTISESPKTFGLIWVGTDDGLVWVTKDSGATPWINVTKGLVPDRYVSRVQASKYQDGVTYVTQNGYRNDDFSAYIFRSEDYGRTWTSIKGNLPDEPINVIKEDPKHAEILYVGTDLGAYVTVDRGKTWQPLVGGLPNVPVHDIVIHPRDNEVILGTHGRSIYIADAKPIQGLLDEVPATAERPNDAAQPGRQRAAVIEGPRMRVIDAPLHLFKVEDIKEAWNWPRENQRQRPSWLRAPETPSLDLYYYTKTAGPVTLALKDADGNVVRTFEEKADVGLNAVTWDYTLDVEKAKKAEEGRKAKQQEGKEGRREEEKKEEAKRETPFKSWMTWYPAPGTYTLELTQGANVEKASFKVTLLPPGTQPPRFFDEPDSVR